MMIKKHLRRGQSILEVVIATTLISMGVIAALSLTNQSQRSSNYSKTLDAATTYNNQAADYLRNQKTQLGFATLAEKFNAEKSAEVATYCLASLPPDSASFLALAPGTCAETDLIQGTPFTRTLTVQTESINEGSLPLTLTTSWYDTSQRNAILTLELTQWK